MEVVSKYRAILAEGPVYFEGRLFWVDIEGKRVIRKDLQSGDELIVEAPDLVSSLCVIDGRRAYATVRHGIYLVDLEGKTFKELVEVEAELEKNRFNDGKCDKVGRYWAGTMNMEKSAPTGSLYKFDGKGVEKMVEGLTVSNGLGWDPDDRLMYLIDSPARKVYAFDFDLKRGKVWNRRELISFSNDVGNPDGMAVDEEGFLWMAHWGGGKVSRWSPQGRKVLEVRLPVTYVSSVTFGGPELDTLYITTAKKDGEPLSGMVFKEKTRVKGLATNIGRL
ncbi:SMP-30/gluconolactonase/LRE family protein [Stygiolobus caldivivus]|uniref:Gluconolactonase n=1 Tax=Stygiolobus caldivivus TaxID=2824673 RepID=A0A8D5ZIZ9_9CREN|nr:SMP-30/gluconolactonase/LRE family protein [Stygiolobus caldivivus]BCU70096.1 gluconolactonase [Stygiolobus caldivivus]